MIKLLSTWSEYSSEFIGDIQLVTHQKEVWDAMRNPKVQIVFNTSLTGDGKTLSALLPALYESRTLDKGLFAYPTNELIRDQEKQIKKWCKQLNIEVEIGQLNSQTLATAIKQENLDRIETLRTIASDNDLILTNPDIFTLIHRLYYDKWGNAARVAQTYLNQYRYLVFDEFHIFNAPQITNVLDGIAFSRATLGKNQLNKFLFLSATPDQMLVERLNNVGITTQMIQGKYSHGLKDSETHRKILHEVHLELVKCQQNTGGVERWVQDNIDRIQKFFANYPNSRGLIIVNSVFTAKRLFQQLQSINHFNINIGENTGLTHPDIRKQSLDKQLIIATSTVDVGVDFAINFLVYESLDAGTFIQRLGRLGRHDGFEIYQAIALVPDWVKEKFNEHYPEGTEIDRENFFEAVKNKIYQKPQEFNQYLSRWGKVLTTLRYAKLSKQKENYQTLLAYYSNEASKLIAKTPYWSRLNELKDHQIIIHELEFFRGMGQLDVWVHEPTTNAVTSMNLIRLLSGTQFKLVSETKAKEISESINQPFYKNNLGLYAKIEDYLDSYKQVTLEFTGYLDSLNLHEAQERKRFIIKTQHIEIQFINKKLECLPLTTCVVDPTQYDIPSLRRRYRLPTFFELNYVRDQGGQLYPVAFGLDALLLDSLLFWQKTNTAIIC